MGLFDIFKKQQSESEAYMAKRRNPNPINHQEQINDCFNNTSTVNSFANQDDGKRQFLVEDVFTISGKGLIVTGQMQNGTFHLGEHIKIQKSDGSQLTSTITGIEQFRKQCTSVTPGDNAGLLLYGLTRKDIQRGDYIVG